MITPQFINLLPFEWTLKHLDLYLFLLSFLSPFSLSLSVSHCCMHLTCTGAGLLGYRLTPSALEDLTPCRAGVLIRISQLHVKHADSQALPSDSFHGGGRNWGFTKKPQVDDTSGWGTISREPLPGDMKKCPFPKKQHGRADGCGSLTAGVLLRTTILPLTG